MPFLAHPQNEKEPFLSSHLLKVAEKARELFSQTGFQSKEEAYYAGLLHDIGKLNPYYQIQFQSKETSQKRNYRDYFRGHSLLSVIAAKWLLGNNPLSGTGKKIVLMAIGGHHTQLRRPAEYFNERTEKDPKFFKSKKEMLENLEKFQRETTSEPKFAPLQWASCLENFYESWGGIDNPQAQSEKYWEDFIEVGSVYSALLEADWGSFYEWKNPSFKIELKTEALLKPKAECRLAELRTRFQEEALQKPFDQKIMVLEAPTGIGKTKLFLDLAKKISTERPLERVFYFSPLLALTEDFESKLFQKNEKSVISESEAENYVLVYNHTFSGNISEKMGGREEESPKLGINWFETESFNKPLIVTTTQRLLITLYSPFKSDKVKLLALKNSLLIVDEVQMIPKEILPNMRRLLETIAEKMNSTVLLVSATIPTELEGIPRITGNEKTVSDYLAKIEKRIEFRTDINPLDEIEKNEGLILLMTNTRKKAKTFLEIAEKTMKKTIYLTSGIRKKDRSNRIKEIKEHGKKTESCLVISTQVIEAGVDVNFQHMYRQAAPLDSIIQASGRLDREGESNGTAKLIVFHNNEPRAWVPYSQLEFEESIKILSKVKNLTELYKALPAYYTEIKNRNLRRKEHEKSIENYMRSLDFQTVWEKLRELTNEEYGTTILVPLLEEWDKIYAEYTKEGEKSKKKIRKTLECGANLPFHPQKLEEKIGKQVFEPTLAEKGIWLPKKEFLSEVYDEKTGLDKWIQN